MNIIGQTLFLICTTILYYLHCKLIPPSQERFIQYRRISKFFDLNLMDWTTNKTFFVIGIVVISAGSLEAEDLVTECLLRSTSIKKTAIKMLTKFQMAETKEVQQFTDTIIIADYIDEYFNSNLQRLLSNRMLWKRENRFIVILIKNAEETFDLFRNRVKLIWTKSKILNFLVIYLTKSSKNCKILSYNPFNDTFNEYNPKGINYSLEYLFPYKLSNLHHHNVSISYCNSEPYSYKRKLDNKLMGLDIDFAKTFLKFINATVSIKEMTRHTEVLDSVNNSSVDLAAIGIFMKSTTLDRAAYPHCLMELVLLVPRAKKLSALTIILNAFDLYSWILIFIVIIVVSGLQKWWPHLSPYNQDPDVGMKILIFSFSAFNIICSQIFLSK